MTTTTETQYGVRYLSGEEDWETRRWFGHIESPEMRESFQEQHNLRLKSFGLPPSPVTFLRRECTTIVTDPEVIDDTVAPDPEPVTDGSETVAPDPDAAPPADLPVTEEESPVEEPSAPTEESNDTGI